MLWQNLKRKMLKISIEDLIEHIEKSLEFGKLEVSKIIQDIFDIPGLTSNKVRCFLNNICGIDGCSYLELGSYRGSTFCSAIYANNLNAVAIDNWSSPDLKPFRSDMWKEWEEHNERENPREEFVSNVKKIKGDNIIKVFDDNYWDFDVNLIPFKIDILFYDGNHTYKDQYQMVTKFKDILSDIFILIVDDWNWERDGILHAIEDLNFKILYDKQIYTNGEDPNDFWNGLGIFLLER